MKPYSDLNPLLESMQHQYQMLPLTVLLLCVFRTKRLSQVFYIISPTLLLLYHLKRLQSLNNCILFLLRTLWLPRILRLWKIKILCQFNATFSLHLRNIKVRYLHPIIILSNIFLKFRLCRLTLRRCNSPPHPYPPVHYVMLRFMEFGQ